MFFVEKPHYTIIFTGITGAGKSAAGNFFLGKEAFIHEDGLSSVTSETSAATSTICGKKVQIIDTPGFFDAHTPIQENYNELIKAFILAKDGIHATAFVLSISHRFNELTKKAVQGLLHFKGLVPFVFVLLTHAKENGDTKEKTTKYIQKELSAKRCASSFKELMQLVNERVIMVDSILYNKDKDYHAKKEKELMEMIECIHKANGCKIYTNYAMKGTACLYEKVCLERSPSVVLDDSTKNSSTLGYYEWLTQKIISSSINKDEISKNDDMLAFLKKYVKTGCIVGTIVGSIVPVVGNLAGSVAGGYIGYKIAKCKHHDQSSKYYYDDHCTQM